MSEERSSPSKLKKLIFPLNEHFNLIGEDIADILWLALKQKEYSNIAKNETSEHLAPSQIKTFQFSFLWLNFVDSRLYRFALLLLPPLKSPKRRSSDDRIKSSQIWIIQFAYLWISFVDSRLYRFALLLLPPSKPKVSIHPPQPPSLKSSGINQKTLPLRHPDPPSLQEPLEFAKALRPLIRKVDSGRKTILDEVETVKRTAEENICIPVFKNEPEPWLDLALIVDENPSMVIWNSTIKELKQLLERYGIFREARIWGLGTDEQGKMVIRAKVGKKETFKNPQEIVDPTHRRLILIVSDCVAPIWFDGTILSILEQWTKHQPLAIIQMLPNFLWQRTGLRIGALVELFNLIPGAANRNLRIHELLLWKDINLKQGTKIPVLTLNPEVTNLWSNFVVGKYDSVITGFVLPLESDFQLPPKSPQSQVEKLDAQQRVNRFRRMSSPAGRNLAGYLMAAPVITLPVVRLIQKNYLPHSQPVHMAEVFLGGLLKPSITITRDTNPDGVVFDVIDDEIRNIILDDFPLSDSVNVFRVISSFIESNIRMSLRECVALLADSSKIGDKEALAKAYAEISLKVLKGMGGNYADFAKELESSPASHGPSSNIDENRILFPEDKGETLRAKIVDDYAPMLLLGSKDARDLAFNFDILDGSLSCIYTGYTIQLETEIDIGRDAIDKGFVTERPYPQSMGSKRFKGDIHNIFPCERQVNAARRNLLFAEIPRDGVTGWFRKGKRITSPPREQIGEYSKLASYGFEPRDSAKGKIARTMFYVYTFYREQVDRDYFEQQKDTLRKWHQEYPSTEAEIERSRKVANSAQGNHNPFILDPTLVERIYFSDESELKICHFEVATIEIQEIQEIQAQFVEKFGGGQGNRFLTRNLQLNGEGNQIVLSEGGQINATMEINHDCPECGTAINQIIVGIAGEERAQACVWMGGSTSNGWQTVSFSLNIPYTSGIYYIRTRYAQAYNREEALGWWKVDRPEGPTEEANIGAVVVVGVNQIGEYAGEYVCAVKWGGVSGNWHEGTEHLFISKQGEVWLRSRFGLAAMQNLTVEDQKLSWNFEDNQTAASINFKLESEDGYFWEGKQTGKLFEGWLQYPEEGRIDFRGKLVAEVVPQFLEFEVLTVNAQGLKIKREKHQVAEYYTEHLGNGITIDMISIPGGSFMMGSPGGEGYSLEKPQHQVTVPSFYMGRYPITQAQWRVVAGWEQIERELDSDPSRFKEEYEGIDRWTRPVERVSWEDAKEFCARLAKKTGKEYRLPTEAEWEYACRAGTETPFHFGENISTELANYDGEFTYGEGVKGESRGQTTPVGYFKVANNFGLSDMHGNVWEWCEDDWHGNYENAPTYRSAWVSESSSNKVRRGGSWASSPDHSRSAYRSDTWRDDRDSFFGVRVVCVAPFQ